MQVKSWQIEVLNFLAWGLPPSIEALLYSCDVSSITQPTLHPLEHFLAAIQHDSFTAAADMMRGTHDADSSAVSELKTIFNTQLSIRRRAKGRTITSAGRDLIIHAERLLQQAHEPMLQSGNCNERPAGH